MRFYVHEMGNNEDGKMKLAASVSPLGFGAINYALFCDRRSSPLVANDIDDAIREHSAFIYAVGKSE